MENHPVVLYSDNHIVVVQKPAGMPSQPDVTGAYSVLDWTREWIRREKGKPEGNVFCGLIHRLDRNVSGVMVLARTSKAASRLSAAFRERKVTKSYLALCEGVPSWSRSQRFRHFLQRNEKNRKTTVFREPSEHAKEAVTRCRLLGMGSNVALVELIPETGRPHQLRAQMAFEGFPLLGDKKYGATRSGMEGLGLHAWRLQFPHPLETCGELSLESPVPETWRMDWGPWQFLDASTAAIGWRGGTE